jgi:hypothetical protein
MSQAYVGGSPVYEREGRRFVEAGIGTIGWQVYQLYNEIDIDGNPTGENYPQPMDWMFFDPAAVAALQKLLEEHRQRLERASKFPVEGMSGEFSDDGLKALYIWPTDEDADETMHLWVDKCVFCTGEKPVVSVVAGYDSFDVCRDCLGKMFDAFNTYIGA